MTIEPRRMLHGAMLAALAAALLPGCAVSWSYSRGAAPAIPAGSSVVVEQALTVPGGSARVYLQGGDIIRFQDRNRFEPWCSFAIEDPVESGGAGTIEPGRFEAGRTRSGARADAGAIDEVRLASRAGHGLALASMDRGGGVGTLTYYIEVPLASSAQPEVRHLRCAIDRKPRWTGRITADFVRTALGERVRVEPPEG